MGLGTAGMWRSVQDEVQGAALGGIHFSWDFVFPYFACSERRQQLGRALLLWTLTQSCCKSGLCQGMTPGRAAPVSLLHINSSLLGEEARD